MTITEDAFVIAKAGDTDVALVMRNHHGDLYRFKTTDGGVKFPPMAASSNTATAGSVMQAGTSATPLVDDTADAKFLSFYFDNGATSGDSRGIYLRQYITGAGGGGDAARFYQTVSNVAAATVRGAHISLDWGTTGSCTGLGAALETTLHIRSTAGMAGTIYSIKAAIHSDAATSDPVGASIAVFGVVNQGDSTGMVDVDTDACLFDFVGWTAATGNMLYANTAATGNHTASIKVRWPGGGLKYIYLWDAQA
jgi:hypothetical protein